MQDQVREYSKKPIVLLILDGFGHRDGGSDNAIFQAAMPTWNYLRTHYAYGTIDASEQMVGLPKGQFGNSEVGHLNIGAGRVIEQDITRIDSAIENGTLAQNLVLKNLIDQCTGRLHLIGLFSDGGVHSHIEHFFAIIQVALQYKPNLSIYVHPFLDGRDTPPKSAMPYLKRLESLCQQQPQVKIGILVGRFFAMDRDNRWERIQAAYDALTGTQITFKADNAVQALQQAYDREENDEFIQATQIDPNSAIRDNDAVLFLNFRADRARELTQALTWDKFQGFKRINHPKLSGFASMTDYGEQYHHPVLFAPQSLANSFGEYIARHGLTQLRIAETEKYPHVTYFFSGGCEQPYPGEERILIPSPKVKTYDLQPEMSATHVTDEIISAVNRDQFDVIICNFANGDMVGHTGVLEAAIKAVETLDICLKRIYETVKNHGGEIVITADHGNCEQMFDNKNNQLHTQHTTNPVPFLYIGRRASIHTGGALKDIAPSLLTLLNLPIPTEMTGVNLINFTS